MRSAAGRSLALGVALAIGGALALLTAPAAAQTAYRRSDTAQSAATVLITGHDLTVDQVAAVARHGAKVQLSPEARGRQADTYALVNEGAAQGVPIYLFNRNPGFLRETARFTGDPLSPENRPRLEAAALAAFQSGATAGDGDEIADSNIEAVLVGAGEARYRGARMTAAEALRAAGLQPVKPHPSDAALGATNSDVAGMAALVVYDARGLLEWVDLAYAIDLDGMNSSVTPLFSPVQANRPYPWINWEAARVLDMLRGGYLFEADPQRIIQDPESLRAGYVRQGAAWQRWAALRDDVTIQMNGSDGNPAAKPGVPPQTSWELGTPWAMQYFVKGGARSKPGYVLSNANWDPYPLGDSLEAFTIALANMDVAVMLRQERFESAFFTRARAPEVLKFDDDGGGIPPIFNANHEVWQRIQALITPVPPEGYSSDPEYDQELDAETLFKVERAGQAVAESWKLVASDLLSGARWMDVRKAQDPRRRFGPAPEATLAALRKVVPLEPRRRSYAGPRPTTTALDFIHANPASSFYPAGPPMPGGRAAP